MPNLPWALALLLACLAPATGFVSAPAYRAAQLDYKATAFGSRRAVVSRHATLASAGAAARRAVVLLPLAEARVPLVARLLSNDTNAAGLVVVLPADDFDAGFAGTKEARALERFLTSAKGSTRVPVYFVRSSDAISGVIADLTKWIAVGSAPTSVSGGWKAVVGQTEPRKIRPAPSLTNYQGLLHGATPAAGAAEPTSSSVLLVVAPYDSFGAAPDLAQGSGSAAAALLEVARLFQKLYAEHSHTPTTSVAFMLSAGSHLNFVGSRAWLTSADPKLLSAVSFVLCLDSLVTDPLDRAEDEGPNHLFLHTARPPDDASVAPLYGRFKAAGKLAGMELETVHKRVNVSAPTAAWEHELFSRRRMAAATLSARSTPPDFLARSSIFERGAAAGDARTIASSVRVVAEALARHALAADGVDVPASESLFAEAKGLGVSESELGSWLSLFGRVPRVAPIASIAEARAAKANDKFKSAVDRTAKLNAEVAARAEVNRSGVLPALSQALGKLTSEVTTMDFELPRDWVFYSHSEAAELRLYRTASIAFDVTLLACVLAYLGALFLGLKLYHGGWAGVRDSLRAAPPPARSPGSAKKRR